MKNLKGNIRALALAIILMPFVALFFAGVGYLIEKSNEAQQEVTK